jgi:hypothetical protein
MIVSLLLDRCVLVMEDGEPEGVAFTKEEKLCPPKKPPMIRDVEDGFIFRGSR